MPLINLKTDLKSLKYGKDTLGGGYSGQPYIQTEIPETFNSLGPREDFILRGGVNAASDSLTDVKRLSKMFADTKSPNGLLFVAKQQLLSRTAVRTQTSGILNGGVYSPLNTLAEAGVVAFGTHLNKQGVNPFAQTGAYANNDNLYFNKVKPNPNDPGGSTKNNRLVKIYNEKQIVKIDDVNVLTYSGGPGAPLGVGRTGIRFADQRTGINNATSITSTKIVTPGDYLKNIGNPINDQGVSGKYVRLTSGSLSNGYNPEGIQQGTYFFNVYEPAVEGNTWPKNSPLIYDNNTFTYNQEDIISTPLNEGKLVGSPKIQDFRANLRAKLGSFKNENGRNSTEVGATPASLNYTNGGNIEDRVNLGDPGQRANHDYSDYAKGLLQRSPNGDPGTGPSMYSLYNTPGLGTTTNDLGLDKINSLPIYRSENATTDDVVNDLVKFRIGIIDNDSPNFKTFLHFRAFLGGITDSYSANWNGFNYLGRGEQFFTYSGFTRQLSLSWTVAAQSKQELIPMYKKLNYLASTLTPDYSPNGYMRGNLAQLTIGGYLYEMPGIITGLTYDIQEDTPWEIGIGSTQGTEDGTVKELPHIIRVTGFNFIPIPRFLPRTQTVSFGTDNDTGFGYNYGTERYIALANGLTEANSNYNNSDTTLIRPNPSNPTNNNPDLTLGNQGNLILVNQGSLLS